MATKYVRESYRDRAKGVARGLPQPRRPVRSIFAGRWTLPQTMVLLVIVCLLFIFDAVMNRRPVIQDEQGAAQAVVTEKHIDYGDGQEPHYLLNLEMTLGDGQLVTIVTECAKQLWESLVEGDAVTVRYLQTNQENRILIEEITLPSDTPQSSTGTASPRAE